MTITRSKIAGGQIKAGYGTEQTGLTIFDTEIDGQDVAGEGLSAVGDSNYSCTRCNVHNTDNGFAGNGGNVTIRDSWVHDLYYEGTNHMEGFLSNGGGPYTLIHNLLECHIQTGAEYNGGGCSAALALYGNNGPIHDVLVQNNYFNVDGSYCDYAGSSTNVNAIYPHANNVSFINNYYGQLYWPRCGQYGPTVDWHPYGSSVWSRNTFYPGGTVVNP